MSFCFSFQSAYDPYDPYSTGTEVNGMNGYDQSSSRPKSLGGTNGYHDPASQSPGSRQNRAMSQDPGYRTGQSGRPLYANPPSSSGMNGGYESSPSSKYSTPPVGGVDPQQQQRYRYADYKPVPPPKTASYKPVPPPKPKTYQPPPPPASSAPNGGQRGSVPMMGISQSSSHQQSMGQSSYIPEGNYMNSGPIHQQQQQQSTSNGGYASSLHYHSSQMSYDQPNSIGHAPNYGPPPPNRYDDDSGQGSSLDRDYHPNGNGYIDRNGGYGSTGGKQPPPPQAGSNHSRGQYYYNVPPGTAAANGTGPVQRRSGDGLDLSNREYRGSAFELYKKPMSEARSLPPNSQHYYNQHQIGR